MTVSAQYKIKTFYVSFKDKETIISKQKIEYGSDAALPENPVRPEEEWGTWKFTEWDGDTENITGDISFYPVYDAQVRSYTVTFLNGDTVLDTQTVMYGKAATAPEDPERAEEVWGTWKFAGWNGDAVFAAQKVEYGASAKTPAEPKKEADAKYSYYFTGWNGDYSVITGDTVIHALYDKKEIPSKTEPGKEVDTGKKKEESGCSNGGEPAHDEGGENTNPVAEDNGGENPNPETEDGNVENPNAGLKEIIEKQTYDTEPSEEMITGELSPDTDYAAEALIEIPIEEQLSEDTDGTETAQEETTEDIVEDGRGTPVIYWIIFLAGILTLGFLFLWLLFQFSARRKVCGTILDESGGIPCGIQLTLSGKDIMEAELGENGSFCFDSLKKEDYRLNVYDADGNKIFSADIRMKGGSGEAVFFILESDCSKIETNRKRGKYEVNLTV